ncbi:MAG: DNA-3-methyladenine glycosylase 2 family protein [Phycisphaerae bacterium]|nr:DNA-3-methyladenine glycosylase 2 family protein [Phycisphaerae bacterium]
MWFQPAPSQKVWQPAVRHLRRVDPVMKTLIKRVGPCTLTPRKDYFVVLCKSIFSQQISTKVAAVMFGRFRDLFPRRRPTPARVHAGLTGEWDESIIRAVGLSRQKRAYLIDLAKHFLDGEIPTRSFAGMDDEAIIEHLTRVKGIGRWTAEMFLIFILNRADVLPVDDLGVLESMRIHYHLPARPTKKEAIALGEIWRPYRTVATWYLWRGLGE